MGELGRRLIALFRRRSMDRDLERELQFHLEMKALETGDPAAARRSVGNPLAWRERGRDVWGWQWLDETFQDVRFAIRGLRRSPGFAAAAILTLALAIGANCLVFTVADAAMFRPLPFREPERLVFVWHKSATRLGMPSIPQFLEWRANSNVFEELGAQRSYPFDIGGGSYSEQITGQQASASFFHVLGVEAVLGRTFIPEEEITGNGRVLLISDRLWRTRFNSDPKVVGTTISGTGFTPGTFTIVGVLPSGVQFAGRGIGDVWIPLLRDGPDVRQGNLNVVARLKPGINVPTAERALATSGRPAALLPFQEDLIGEGRPAMWMLGIAVSLVLLIACVNVANLTLARGADRIRELTIRAAIGAGRQRLVRQLLTESLVLGMIGTVAGTAFAYASIGAVKGLMPKGVFRGDTVAVDLRALAFTLTISLMACLLFGLLPALRASRAKPRPGLLGSGRQGKRTFLRGGLVVVEIALALILVTGAGLMTKSLVRLVWKDLGFDRQDTLTLRTGLPMDVYQDSRLRVPMERDIVTRVQSLPGIRYVSISDTRPLGFGYMPTRARKSPADAPLRVSLAGVTPGFFDAMGIPVRDGRRFTEQDVPGAAEVAIVNEAAARIHWPNERPVGKSILVDLPGKPETDLTVVGLVGDTIGLDLTGKRGPAIYVPHAQRLFSSGLDIVIRVAPGISTASLVPAIRTELARVNRTLSVQEVLTMQSVIDKHLAEPRFLTTVLGVFAILALILTMTGVVGVVAYLVRSRTYEFGVRMALGATSGDILRLILSYGGRLAIAGIVLGIAGALGLTQLLTAFLYEVKPTDTATMVSVPLLVLVAVLLACYAPARRAMRIDPAHSLRHD